MWMRRLVAQLDDALDLLQALGRMLMVIDAKLDEITGMLEEDG
jgi:hypothetical protein